MMSATHLASSKNNTSSIRQPMTCCRQKRARKLRQGDIRQHVSSLSSLGMLNPILVRRKGDKYEVISGHRRLAAYRRLQFAAKSEKEKQKYGAIPARELPSVTDEQMLLLGLTENLLRADISPLDAALGLLALQ